MAIAAAACLLMAGFCAGYGTAQVVELLRSFRPMRPLPRPVVRPEVLPLDPFTRELARRYRAGVRVDHG